MVQIAKIQFNPFGENTYILFNERKQAIIVDPGCSNTKECQTLAAYIQKNEFEPIMVLSTHGHIDHVCGASFAVDTFKVPFALHGDDYDTLHGNLDFCASMGFDMTSVPSINVDLSSNNKVMLGDDVIEIIHTPGHTKGGVCLLFNDGKMMLTGDTLFHGSIGRTDLPGGDYNQLMDSIIKKLLPLGDVRFFPGHGGDSTIGQEANSNPFIVEVIENRVNPVYEN